MSLIHAGSSHARLTGPGALAPPDDIDEEQIPCCLAQHGDGLLAHPLPGIDDVEGARLPESLPPVVDAHVHVFPPRLFEAVWRWFDTWGWPIRYRLQADAALDFLRARGVAHAVALHYAHKPGIARGMNRFVADLVGPRPDVTGVATVHPDDDDIAGILREGFALGLRGVKLHCHVQCFAPDDPRLDAVYATCAAAGLPLIMHAGREPKSPGYACDPHALCGVERVEAVLRAYPTVRLCVPHLGMDELAGYARLLVRYDTLWLDTTMTLADYFAPADGVGASPRSMLEVRPDRVLFGTDFPNLPYAWDREIARIARMGLGEARLGMLLHGAAGSLFGAPLVQPSVR